MATYKVQVHPLVYSEDILNLPNEIQLEFRNKFYQNQLSVNPINPRITPSFAKTGKLKNCRALHIEWEGDINYYRLVYQILDKPSPRSVRILSFAEHDPAYDLAKKRLGRTKRRKN